jgi:ketosteroid isomerase-like protein
MKKLILALIAITLVAIAAPAQSKDEQEILKIHHGLDQAYVKGDVAPFENAMAEYYTFTGPSGTLQSRADMLKEMRDEIAKPTFKNISEVSDDVKVHVLGNSGLVTATWTSVSQGLGAGDEPHTDRGQYTGIYEKIEGRWMLIRENFTEAPHDLKVMEAGVLKASNAFDAIMKSRDKAGYERMLHADYTYTTEDGKLVSRADDLAHFSSADTVITLVEASDKKVRIISNTSAVETGMYHVTGTSKGKVFDETGRYTTTWIWKDLRWQVIADHNSIVKK